jgi:hypothetical protein
MPPDFNKGIEYLAVGACDEGVGNGADFGKVVFHARNIVDKIGFTIVVHAALTIVRSDYFRRSLSFQIDTTYYYPVQCCNSCNSTKIPRTL